MWSQLQVVQLLKKMNWDKGEREGQLDMILKEEPYVLLGDFNVRVDNH